MPKIAHVWEDYLSDTFVEVHPYLLHEAGFTSVNVVGTLWDNGKVQDCDTFAFRRRPVEKLLAGASPLARVRDWLYRRTGHAGYRKFCLHTLEREHADVVHAHFGTTAAQLIPVFRAAGRPVVVTFYGADVSSALKREHWRSKYRDLFLLVEKCIVLCETARARLSSLGCPDNKLIVWNLPAGVEKYPYCKREPGETTELVIAARFVEKKGHRLLLRAFRKLLDHGIAARLTMIGYGPLKQLLEKTSAELGISCMVRIVDTRLHGDFAKTYYEELKTKDVFVLPSIEAPNGDDEGGPALTMVCAQASGLPVVCTRFPGAEVTLHDGESGFFCEPDPDDITRKLRILIADPECRARMGHAASRLAFENFAASSQIPKMLAVYRSL